jgi:hypothetical protein
MSLTGVFVLGLTPPFHSTRQRIRQIEARAIPKHRRPLCHCQGEWLAHDVLRLPVQEASPTGPEAELEVCASLGGSVQPAIHVQSLP